MSRRRVLQGALAALGALLFGRPARPGEEAASEKAAPEVEKLSLPLSEWRRRLTPEQYAVLFEEATERRRSSPLNEEKRDGIYVCAACHLPLFESSAKFDSGTGWPSFFRAIPGRIGTRPDFSLLLKRTEYHCARCGGHQGHVFDDGPPPTGLRYCNNGVALLFVVAGEPLPELVS